MALYTANNRRLDKILHSSRESTYAVALITVFIAVLILFLAILPAYRSITDQVQNNKVKTAYLKDLNAKKTNMDLLLKQYNSNTAAIDNFNKYNLSRNNNELVLTNLDKIANNYNIKLLSLSFSKVVTPTNTPYNSILNLESQPISCQLKGTLADFHDFLAYIDSFPVIINISSISYTHGSSDSSANATNIKDDPIFTISLSGEYYFWNKPTQQ